MSNDPETSPVVVGVIDDGIAFIHERFRIGLEPRVEYWWWQDGPLGGGGSGTPGRVLDKAAIRGHLARVTDASGTVDEDRFYSLVGIGDFSINEHKAAAWRVAHGTHVMDTATGYDGSENQRNRPIVAVQLPTASTADTSGATLTDSVLRAVYFILACADEIALRLKQSGQITTDYVPVVINLSYGVISTIYLGTSMISIEWLLDQIVQARKARFGPNALEIVLPAGNSNLSRCHAAVTFAKTSAQDPAKGVAVLNWRVQPDDRSLSFVDIVLPPRTGGPPSRLTLTLTPPGGTVIFDSSGKPLGENPGQIYSGAGCSVQYVASLGPAQPGRFRITLLPTADLDAPSMVAAAGLWQITLTNHYFSPRDVIDAVIQRDETPYGYRQGGRQSYFDHECYRRYDNGGHEIEWDDPRYPCVVVHAGLLNAIGRGDHPIVMGGYISKEDVAADYTAGGPTRNPSRPSPDAMCPSEDSKVHRGVLAAGSRSGSVVVMGGTSIAAPRATRWIAKRLARGKTGNRNDVQYRARLDELAPGREPPPPPARAGAGRILYDHIFPNPLPRYDK